MFVTLNILKSSIRNSDFDTTVWETDLHNKHVLDNDIHDKH